jgi:hypothetical protein
MKIKTKTKIRAGSCTPPCFNHNGSLVQTPKPEFKTKR